MCSILPGVVCIWKNVVDVYEICAEALLECHISSNMLNVLHWFPILRHIECIVAAMVAVLVAVMVSPQFVSVSDAV